MNIWLDSPSNRTPLFCVYSYCRFSLRYNRRLRLSSFPCGKSSRLPPACTCSFTSPKLRRHASDKPSRRTSVPHETSEMQKPAAGCRPFLLSEKFLTKKSADGNVHLRSNLESSGTSPPAFSVSPPAHRTPHTHRPSVQYLNYFTKPITRHTWPNTKILTKK